MTKKRKTADDIAPSPKRLLCEPIEHTFDLNQSFQSIDLNTDHAVINVFSVPKKPSKRSHYTDKLPKVHKFSAKSSSNLDPAQKSPEKLLVSPIAAQEFDNEYKKLYGLGCIYCAHVKILYDTCLILYVRPFIPNLSRSRP